MTVPPPPPTAPRLPLAPPPPPPTTPIAARRGPLGMGFWVMWLAAAVSGIGDGLVVVAFPLLAERLTDEPMLIVGVTVVDRLPALLFGLHAGAAADRYDRRRVLQISEIARFAAVGALALAVVADRASIVLLYATVFVIGTAQAAFEPGAHAVLPSLVRRGDLTRANGHISVAQSSTHYMLGPAVGGALFAIAVAAPFVVDSVSFALSALLLTAAIPASARRPPRALRADREERRSLTDDVREGLGYFRRNRTLRAMSALIAVFALCQTMVMAPLVIFAVRTLGLSARDFGIMLGIAAVGDVLGGLVAARLDERFGAARVLGGCGLLAAAGYLMLSLSPGMVIATAALFLESLAVSTGQVANLAVRQRIIPNHLLGRVSNIFRFTVYAMLPIGALLGGALGNLFGLRIPFVVAAMLQASAVVVVAPRLIRLLPPPRRDHR